MVESDRKIRIIFGPKATPENQASVLKKLESLKELGVEVEAYDSHADDPDILPSPVLHHLGPDGEATRLTFGREAVEKELAVMLNPDSQK